MANWCNNTVVFEGTSEAIEQITQLFKSMAEQEQKDDCGHYPISYRTLTEIISTISVRTMKVRAYSSMKQNGRQIRKPLSR
jgi:negative regulator of genetic competence, sporulation and motility